MNCIFRKMASFEYKSKRYQVFINKLNKFAFLEVKNNKYFYPDLRTVLELVSIFYKETDTLCIRHDGLKKKKKIKKYRFIPKVIYGGCALILSSVLLSACGKHNTGNLNIQNTTNTNYSVESTDENMSELENNTPTEEEINQKYLDLLATADDEFDYLYASDYYQSDITKNIIVRDSKNYNMIYEFGDVTLDMIRDACERNSNIPREYKDFIIQYVTDWLELYPNTNFGTLYHNLQTLKINVVNKEGMMRATVSMDSVACYKKSENAIYVLESIDLSKNGDDYIILAHELSHCARNAKFTNKDGYTVRVSFIDSSSMGYYAEEALITDFVYGMQGLGGKSNFYTLQSSYFRIILDCIDYNGADFMNHSVNYLIDKMDEFMEDEQYAYHIIALIDAEASLRYTDYIEVDFNEFDELYKYITRMYAKKYLTSNMTYEETLDVYENLIDEITYYFDEMKNPYDIDFSIFENEFNSCIEELGIEKSSSLQI